MRLPLFKTCLRYSGLFLLFLSLGTAQDGEHVPGRLIVRRRANVEQGQMDRALRGRRASLHNQIDGLGLTIVDVPEESSQAIRESLEQSGLFEFVERDYYAHTAAAPNDPSFGSQWHLPQIQAPSAWGMTTGSSSVIVAVIDSGVDATHPDLASKLLPGWSFLKSSPDVSDTIGHGTAVSGVVAAATNNSRGIAGVSWGSMILPLAVVDSNDFASYSNMAAAMQYAADHGARVINISLGGASASSVLQRAVDYAWNKGVTVVASAMNNSTSTPYYPAACNHVIAVSATDNADNLAGFSNFGNWITLSAPGTNILTTMNGGSYGYWYGTSFSSPIVAGVAALMLAANPNLTTTSLLSLLEQSADDLGAAGYDSSFGYGRVNAYKAVTAVRAALAQAAPTISIMPKTVSLTAGQAQQFSATVTGLQNTGVSWTLSPLVGTIVGGLYTAPASISTSQTITVSAIASNGTTTATAAVSLTAPSAPAPPPSSTFTAIRVNAGDVAYTDAQGRVWSADTGYGGGATWSVSAAIANTATPKLYQSCRYGDFSYQYAVPNGTYTVNLKFAEVSMSGPGQRVFNVDLNGTAALTNFDIFAQAGKLTALDKSFTVSVTNGQLAIHFTRGPANAPLINAIEILPGNPMTSTANSFAPLRVNAGGGTYRDPQGTNWNADTGYAAGSTWSIANPISNTASPALYQSCRYGDFGYQFSVPNGTYTVTLKFAEIYMNAAGQRVFNVAINGTAALTNFDIFAQAGKFTALDKAFTVSVTNGLLAIQFARGTADLPMVNGIEILGN